jgi:integrase
VETRVDQKRNRFIQELLGHQSPRTTQIYTRVSQRSIQAISSPLDRTWGERPT